MRRCVLSLSLVVALGLPAGVFADSGTRNAVDRYAIVIGNNLPDTHNVPVLRYADDDAVATHRMLVEAGVDSVLLVRPDVDTRRLDPSAPSGGPTLVGLDRALARLNEDIDGSSARGRDTELLVFFSGHGDVVEGEGYLVMEDGRLTRTRLYDVLTRSHADRNHVIVDACKSYFVAFEKGAEQERHRYAGSFGGGSVPARLNNTGFILSTSSARDSHEWERFQAGIFSYEIRSALRGAADANTDGTITYGELGAFLTSANQAIVNPRFRPEFTVRPPGKLGAGVLAWTGIPGDSVRIDGVVGHVYLENANGKRLADVHPASRGQLLVRTPRERPLFVRAADESAELRVDQRGELAVARLPATAVAVARKGAMHLAFEKLFSTPFGPDSVSHYREEFRRDAPPGLSAPGPAPPQPTRAERVSRWMGGVAIASAGVGVAFSALAVHKFRQGSDASQVERAEINDDISRYNKVSLAWYGLAAVSGATWWLLRPDDADDADGSLAVAPTAGRSSVGLTVLGRF